MEPSLSCGILQRAVQTIWVQWGVGLQACARAQRGAARLLLP